MAFTYDKNGSKLYNGFPLTYYNKFKLNSYNKEFDNVIFLITDDNRYSDLMKYLVKYGSHHVWNHAHYTILKGKNFIQYIPDEKEIIFQQIEKFTEWKEHSPWREYRYFKIPGCNEEYFKSAMNLLLGIAEYKTPFINYIGVYGNMHMWYSAMFTVLNEGDMRSIVYHDSMLKYAKWQHEVFYDYKNPMDCPYEFNMMPMIANALAQNQYKILHFYVSVRPQYYKDVIIKYKGKCKEIDDIVAEFYPTDQV